MHSNREILGAVLGKWLEPMASGLTQRFIAGMPIIQAIDAKVKNTGWVTQNWSIVSEVEPLIGNAASAFLAPMIAELLANVSDEAIPGVARATIDGAMRMGELRLFEGKVTFDENDLQRLDRLLELNLPISADAYQVKE